MSGLIKNEKVFEYNVVTDHAGNIYVTGGTEIDLCGNSKIGEQDVFVVKLNQEGQFQWARQMGAAGKVAVGNMVRVDELGNVYVSGVTTGPLGDNDQVGCEDMFVAKYNHEGDLQWIRQMGVSGQSTKGTSSVVGTSGNVYVLAEALGANPETFISKINSSGVLQWIRQIRVESVTA